MTKRKKMPEGTHSIRVIEKSGTAWTHTFQDGEYIGRKKWHGSNSSNEEWILFRKKEREKKQESVTRGRKLVVAQKEQTSQVQKEFTKEQSRYIYVCKGKGKILSISSRQLIYMPMNSSNRIALYQAIIQKYQNSDGPSGDLNLSDLELLMTYDAMSGTRRLGGP